MSERFFAGLLAGAAWNAASVWCLGRLLRAWLGPAPSTRRAVGWLAVKFPLLYLLVFLLISQPGISVAGFGCGFTLVLAGVVAWYALRVPRFSGVRSHGR